MNNRKALFIYVSVVLVALLVGKFLNAGAGWFTLLILFLFASSFIIWRKLLANPLDLEP